MKKMSVSTLLLVGAALLYLFMPIGLMGHGAGLGYAAFFIAIFRIVSIVIPIMMIFFALLFHWVVLQFWGKEGRVARDLGYAMGSMLISSVVACFACWLIFSFSRSFTNISSGFKIVWPWWEPYASIGITSFVALGLEALLLTRRFKRYGWRLVILLYSAYLTSLILPILLVFAFLSNVFR